MQRLRVACYWNANPLTPNTLVLLPQSHVSDETKRPVLQHSIRTSHWNLIIPKALCLRRDQICSLYRTTNSIRFGNSCSMVRSYNTKASDIIVYACEKGKVNFNIAWCLSTQYLTHCKRIGAKTQRQTATVIWHHRERQTYLIEKKSFKYCRKKK